MMKKTRHSSIRRCSLRLLPHTARERKNIAYFPYVINTKFELEPRYFNVVFVKCIKVVILQVQLGIDIETKSPVQSSLVRVTAKIMGMQISTQR